jgi:hypothetical protein
MSTREVLERITPTAQDVAFQLEEGGHLLEASSILRLLLIIHLDLYEAMDPPCVQILLFCCRFLARHGEYDRIRQLRTLLETASSGTESKDELSAIMNTISMNLPNPGEEHKRAAA